MQAIINVPFYDKFMQLCAEAVFSMKLCAPFVKSDILRDVYAVKNPHATVELVTNVNLMSFCKQASDLAAISQVVDNGGDAYNYSGLHAKFYIFDHHTTVITSANLTSSGLKRNYEYGVITNERDLIATSLSDYSGLCTSERCGRITANTISQVEKILSEIKPLPVQDIPKMDAAYFEDVFDKDKHAIFNNLTGWDKAVFMELDKLDHAVFEAGDAYGLVANIAAMYPDNHNPEAKIRQALQHLRDFGLIQFISRGVYKKLWL
ncbi:hypothetical protein FACS1894185_4200 [Betaproteobacteria bacterium]|nr:hypothetical protein FACS1894185_4200 [Betaproteobacteria bacterium]GHU14878.1 hypothetical protein FACS189441_5650 [Betaproteobacteria bacterium]